MLITYGFKNFSIFSRKKIIGFLLIYYFPKMWPLWTPKPPFFLVQIKNLNSPKSLIVTIWPLCQISDLKIKLKQIWLEPPLVKHVKNNNF